MPKRALAEHRPWLLASLVAAISYFFVANDAIPGVYLMVWKGAGVAFLAAYAWHRTRGTDGLLIGLVMALGAIGDVGVELSLVLGAGFFALGHIVAIVLYGRNRRARLTASQMLAGLALAIFSPLLAGLISYPQPGWSTAVVYAALLGVMAAMAWTSRFTRYRVGIGAVLFVASDLIIFAQEAGKVSPEVGGMLIWPLYYAGQLLIAMGVVQALRADHDED